jgi:hypothetical protein
MAQHTYCRLYGMTLGAAWGLACGLTSRALNLLAVPDVMFYQPTLGMTANGDISFLSAALSGTTREMKSLVYKDH